MKKTKKFLILGVCLLLAFALFTVLVKTVDVQTVNVGKEKTDIGFAAINTFCREKIGYHNALYELTEVLGYGVLLVAAGLAIWGLSQMIRRKSLKMDRQLWFLAALYVAVMAFYAGFEVVVINCRPVLMEGVLEASYPSSHTMLAVCILGSALILLKKRVPCSRCRRPLSLLGKLLMAAVVAGRLASGVHWVTDIFASLLLSGGLLALYAAAIEKEEKEC